MTCPARNYNQNPNNSNTLYYDMEVVDIQLNRETFILLLKTNGISEDEALLEWERQDKPVWLSQLTHYRV